MADVPCHIHISPRNSLIRWFATAIKAAAGVTQTRDHLNGTGTGNITRTVSCSKIGNKMLGAAFYLLSKFTAGTGIAAFSVVEPVLFRLEPERAPKIFRRSRLWLLGQN